MLASGLNVLRNILGVETPSNRVKEAKSQSYSSRNIHLREDALVLYLPATVPAQSITDTSTPTTSTNIGHNNNKKNDTRQSQSGAQYEIVLHRPYTETLHQTYSLYRSASLADAESKFITFRVTLVVFVDICKEMYNVQGLQRTCDVLAEHPSWNLAHLAAYFGLNEAFRDPRVNTFLNSTDQQTGLSPLQCAIMAKNLKTVQLLVAADCSLQHLDHCEDSVFHYAASTTRDIISALTTQQRSSHSSGATSTLGGGNSAAVSSIAHHRSAPAQSTSQQPQQQSSPCYLSMRNRNGYTPLHIACQADKADCVMALLLAGADVNKTATVDGVAINAPNVKPGYVSSYLQANPNSLYKADMKSGGTPLHWARSRPVVDALIEQGCHIDALNFEGRTALHIMVLRQRLDCVVALLSHQANVDVADRDGNRPLHLAVKHHGNLAICQALIIFGTQLDAVNHAGHTVRHLVGTSNDSQRILYYLHAVGARRCTKGVFNCGEGCRPGGTYDGIPPPPTMGPTKRNHLNQMLAVGGSEIATATDNQTGSSSKTKPKSGGRLLSLDGGGIRGLVLVMMLIEIEAQMDGVTPLVDYFDWLAGTSTGGILALGMATGKTLRECLCLYFRIKEKTFVGLRPYASEPLEQVLKAEFGSDTVMTDIRRPKIMVTGVLADRQPVELHLFRNYCAANQMLGVDYDSPYEAPAPPSEQYVWQVGRATGAAPTYFRAFGRYLDGGLIANNPTLDAMAEVHEYNLALKAVGKGHQVEPLSLVVSLGTGVIPTTAVTDIDVFLPGSIFDGLKLYTGMTALGSLLVDQATAADGRVVERARAWCSTIGVPYHRFSPQLSEDVVMNESSDEKLCRMLWETKAYMHENHASVRQLVDVLVNSHP